MDDLWSVRRFCRWFYELPEGVEPSKSQVNMIGRKCANGTLPAVKIGKKWFVDTAEIIKEVRNA